MGRPRHAAPLVQLPRLAVQFGVNTVRSFVSGINGMAQSAVDWFKQKLGIHSPSRLFMGLGGHMITDLAKGIGEGDAPHCASRKAVATSRGCRICRPYGSCDGRRHRRDPL